MTYLIGYFCHTCWPCYDVIGTDCWAQTGSTHGHVFQTFKGRNLITHGTRNRVKKTAVCISTFYFIPIKRTLLRVFGAQ